MPSLLAVKACTKTFIDEPFARRNNALSCSRTPLIFVAVNGDRPKQLDMPAYAKLVTESAKKGKKGKNDKKGKAGKKGKNDKKGKAGKKGKKKVCMLFVVNL